MVDVTQGTPNVPQLQSPIFLSNNTDDTVNTGISLSYPTTDVGIPTAEVAAQRGYKAELGLGPILKQDKNQLAKTISDGGERMLRTQAALDMDLKNTDNRNQAIVDLANKKGGPLEPAEVARVIDPFAPNNRPVDPESVLERAYATSLISTLNTAAGYMQDTSWDDARLNMPKVVQKTMEDGSELAAKRAYFQTQIENLQNTASKQGWGGWTVDQVKGLSQVYQEAKLRGNVEGVGYLDGIGLGANIQEQTDKLFSLPIDEMVKKVGPVLQKLSQDNPSLAVSYAKDLLGQSESDARLKNLFTALAPLDIYEGSKLGVKGIKALGQYRETQTAVKQIMEAGAKRNVTPESLKEASGDVAGASVEKVTDNLVSALQGTVDPSKLTAEAMTSNYRNDIRQIGDLSQGARPNDSFIGPMQSVEPSLNRELVTRVQDNLVTATQDIPGTLLEMNNLDRLPLVLNTKEKVATVMGSIRDDYRGPKNSILDVQYKGINEFTNTRDYDLIVGNTNGELFSNPDTAANFAKDHGFGAATIESREGLVASSRDENLELKIRKLEETKKSHQQELDNIVKDSKDKTKTKEERKVLREQAKIQKEAGVDQVQKQIDKANELLLKGPQYKANNIPEVKPGFETSKGSKYVLHEDGTTTRDKAARAEHPGDKGIKPRSNETFYITEEEYNAYKNSRERGDKSYQDKRGTTLYTDIANDVSILPKREPKVGLVPVEVWNDGKTRSIHFGNAITKVIDHIPAVVAPRVRVQQQGVGFYLRVTKPLNETAPAIRDLMINDLKGQIETEAASSASKTSNWVNALIGKYRSPEDTLSIVENRNRKVAVYSESVIQKLAKPLAKNIEDLQNGIVRVDPVTGKSIPWAINRPSAWFNKLGNKKVYEEWQRAVDYARDAIDPIDKKPGYFFKTAGELEQFYMTTFQRTPSYQETLAYFSKVELDELHRTLANIAVYRNKARLGAEQHALTYVDGLNRTQSAFFDGVQRKEFPGGDGNILVMDSSSGKQGKVYTLSGNHMPANIRKDYIEQVRTGKLKVVEIYDPEMRPLNGFGQTGAERIQYVLSDLVESKPLSYDQVPRRGGGHFEYDYNLYVKQAGIKTDVIGNSVQHHYEGDNTFAGIKTAAEGKELTQKLETVRQLMKEGRFDEAKDFTQTNMSIEWKDLKAKFNPSRDASGTIHPAAFSLEEPFHVVPKGKSIFDLDKSLEKRYPDSFKDGTRHGSLARQYQVAYTKERDAMGLQGVTNTGTKDKPYFTFAKADMVDALPTMQRALNRAIKSTFMDDYKIFATENWLREAENYLKADITEVRSSPFYHFNNPVFKSGTPLNIERNLMSNKYKIDQFVGVPNDFDAYIHSVTQHLTDAAYDKYGPEASRTMVQKAQTVVPIFLLQKVKDPITFIRSVTFNAKLGLFAVPQLLVQMQTHTSILALNPTHGTAGTFAMLLHQWARHAGSDEVLRSLDVYASKFNAFGSKFKPGEFLEARREFAKTGFEHVGGEYATLDDAFNHKFIQNDIDKVLSLGQTFFKEGERASRVSSWYTAFREFRAENPTGALTASDRAKILQKADLLTTNMSRASSSALHGGVLSLTTQFLSYQLRVAELFWGDRISSMAKMRMAAFYSMAYGVPSAIGITGLPIQSDLREFATNHSYIPGEKYATSMLMEGLPAVTLALITGGGDMQKGNMYDVGNRFGSGGLTSFREALRSDAEWWKILGGAGVSTFVNTVANMDGLTKAVVSLMRGDSTDTRFKLTADDVIDAGKEISSVSNANKLYTALQTGKWVSKNGSYVTDVSPANAAFLAMTGLNPTEGDTIYEQSNITKGETGAQKTALNKFITEMRRAITAGENKDEDGALAFKRRAQSYLEAVGYPREKMAQAYALAFKGWESRAESADFSFYLRNVPTDKVDQRREDYKDKQKLNDYRKQ